MAENKHIFDNVFRPFLFQSFAYFSFTGLFIGNLLYLNAGCLQC